MEDFRFKKRYGQNFLKNPQILKRIASIPQYKDNSLIIEVGPGKGALTEHLALVAKKVICYEIDTDLEDDLTILMNDYPNVQVFFDDFLKRDLQADLKDYSNYSLYFVSNVPYYITTPILFKLLESSIPFEQIVMLVQKEVGERFIARTGTKQYGALTVLLNYYFQITKGFTVGRQEFVPVPHVDSLVVSFKRKDELLPLKDEKKFFELVHDSFRFKRKTIYNNLRNYPIQKLELILKEYGFTLQTRAEELPIEVFVALANNL